LTNIEPGLDVDELRRGIDILAVVTPADHHQRRNQC
jgi:hypothetical protein